MLDHKVASAHIEHHTHVDVQYAAVYSNINLSVLVFSCRCCPPFQVKKGAMPFASKLEGSLKERGIPMSRIWLRFTPPQERAAEEPGAAPPAAGQPPTPTAAAAGGPGVAGAGAAGRAPSPAASPAAVTRDVIPETPHSSLGDPGEAAAGGGAVDAGDGAGTAEDEGAAEGDARGGARGWPCCCCGSGGWSVELLEMLLDCESMERLWSNTLVGGNALRLCSTVSTAEGGFS